MGAFTYQEGGDWVEVDPLGNGNLNNPRVTRRPMMAPPPGVAQQQQQQKKKPQAGAVEAQANDAKRVGVGGGGSARPANPPLVTPASTSGKTALGL